jgi:hypothetical protein
MDKPLETREYRGYTINVWPDEWPVDPRASDDLGHMLCSHRRYRLGDEQVNENQFNSWEEVREYISNERDAAVILPLYLMDHSGLYLSTGGFGHVDPGRWDWGQVGFIYATREAVLKEYSNLGPETIEKVKKVLEDEVSLYAQYLTGEIYGFTIKDPLGEAVDSAWGFYGVDEHLWRECYDIIDQDISEHRLVKRAYTRVLEALDRFAYVATEGNFSPKSDYTETAGEEADEEGEEEACTS